MTSAEEWRIQDTTGEDNGIMLVVSLGILLLFLPSGVVNLVGLRK